MDQKVKELKSALSRYGIETKNLRKSSLIELLKFVENSAVFNKKSTTECFLKDDADIKNDSRQLITLCNECSKLKSKINTQVEEISFLNSECDKLKNELSSIFNEKKLPLLRKANAGKLYDNAGITSKSNVLILADNHGRGLSDLLRRSNIENKYNISALFKPNANFDQIVNNIANLSKKFGSDDFVIIIGGSNNISHTNLKKTITQISNECSQLRGSNNISHTNFKKTITQISNECSQTNVIFTTVPYQYDKYEENGAIFKANKIICETVANIQKYSNQLNVIDINSDLSVSDYTKHGLHLNNKVFQADCKRALALLTHLNNDELDEFINSEEKLQSLLDDIEQNYLKDIENEKETLLASNTSLSEFNLAREPALVEGRERIVQLSSQGEEISKNVEQKLQEIRDKTGDMSLETALALLQTAASEIEEDSDNVVSKFLSNDLELDDFLEDFLNKRKIMHTRLVKAEKMAKILSRDPALNNIPNYVNAPPVNINRDYFPSINPATNLPYPVGDISMPMPGNINYFQNHY
ncbi:hypothetical protein FQR65_LT07285 [Abscondita terminalis]|nr:hypothetical protein FQR65_LT07285 [Abscondita terminalis]